MAIAHGILGLACFILIAVALSENRQKILLRPILAGIVIQIILAIIVTKIHLVIRVFQWLNHGVIALDHATLKGTSFVFGFIGGGQAPFHATGSTFSIVPETQEPTDGHKIYIEPSLNAIDALIKGVKIGGEIFVSIIAMLIVLIALVAFVSQGLALLPHINGHTITLSYLIGFILQPFMWLMGIPWRESHIAGGLMATRMVLNELVAYGQLAHLAKGTLDPRSQLMMLYAMCGFANISSLGIMLSSYNVLIPERRKEFLPLAFKALIAGTICTCMTATIVGVLYTF